MLNVKPQFLNCFSKTFNGKVMYLNGKEDLIENRKIVYFVAI